MKRLFDLLLGLLTLVLLAVPMLLVALAEWLRTVFLGARSSLAHARRRFGRRFLNLAQVVAVRSLMERLGVGVQACRAVLRARPELRRAVRFRHPPEWRDRHQ